MPTCKPPNTTLLVALPTRWLLMGKYVLPPMCFSKNTSYCPVKASDALVQLTVSDVNKAPSRFRSAPSVAVTLVGAAVKRGLGKLVFGAISMPKVSPKFQLYIALASSTASSNTPPVACRLHEVTRYFLLVNIASSPPVPSRSSVKVMVSFTAIWKALRLQFSRRDWLCLLRSTRSLAIRCARLLSFTKLNATSAQSFSPSSVS